MDGVDVILRGAKVEERGSRVNKVATSRRVTNALSPMQVGVNEVNEPKETPNHSADQKSR
jgi:hypothetical protein